MNPLLGESDNRKAKAYVAKLVVQYKPFFTNLTTFYGPHDRIGKDIRKAYDSIGTLIPLIKLTFFEDVVPDPKNLKQINDLMTEIEDTTKRAIEYMKSSKDLSDILSKTEEASGVSNEQLTSSIQMRKEEKNPKSKRQPPSPSIQYGAGGMIGSAMQHLGIGTKTIIGGTLASQIAAPLLGPFFGAAVGALGAAKFAPKAIGLGMKGIRRVIHAPGAAIRGLKRTGSESVNSMADKNRGMWDRGKQWMGTDPWAKNQGQEAQAAESTAYSGSEAPAVAVAGGKRAGGAPLFRTMNRRQKEAATDGLYYFFNKRAFNARWTKSVLVALKGGRGGGVGGGGGLGQIAKLGLVGGALAIAGVAIYKLVQSVKELNDVQKAVHTSVQKQINVRQKFYAKGLNADRARIDASDATPEEKQKQKSALVKNLTQRHRRDLDEVEKSKPWTQKYFKDPLKSIKTYGLFGLKSQKSRELESPPINAGPGTSGSSGEQTKKIEDKLDSLIEVTKAAGKIPAQGTNVSGPYSSVETVLDSLNQQGADSLQERMR